VCVCLCAPVRVCIVLCACLPLFVSGSALCLWFACFCLLRVLEMNRSSMSSLNLHTCVEDQLPRHESLRVVGHECLNFEKQVCRLADFFSLDRKKLNSQFVDVKGLATTIQSMGQARMDNTFLMDGRLNGWGDHGLQAGRFL
jgi:hypothetical protein